LFRPFIYFYPVKTLKQIDNMNSNNAIDRKFTGEWFISLANQFVGLKATLFAYSPGFSDLYIVFEKGGRYFLLKFSSVTYMKMHREWTFKSIELQENKVKDDHSKHKFFDGDSFEVTCYFFSVLEIINGRDVWNNQNTF
ncbi:MAG: hypothetical protein ACKO96_12035, partial [Flammeovirgaceae bacterium]